MTEDVNGMRFLTPQSSFQSAQRSTAALWSQSSTRKDSERDLDKAASRDAADESSMMNEMWDSRPPQELLDLTQTFVFKYAQRPPLRGSEPKKADASRPSFNNTKETTRKRMQDLSVTELAHGLSIVEPIMRDTLHQIMQYADDAKQAYQNSIKANEQHKEEIMNTLKHATDKFCKGKENLLKISDTLYDLINANKCSSKISEKMLGQIEEKIGHLNKKVQSMADRLAGMKRTAMVPVKIEGDRRSKQSLPFSAGDDDISLFGTDFDAVAYAHDEIKRDPRALNGRVSVRASEEPRVKKRSLRVIEENDKILLSSASEFDGYKREEVAKSETPGPKVSVRSLHAKRKRTIRIHDHGNFTEEL